MSLVLLLLVSGCVNLKPKPDRSKQYVLGANDQVIEAAGTMHDWGTLYVARPNLPLYPQTKHLVFTSKDGEVKSLNRTRWAEPLEEGVARTIADYINQRLGTPNAQYYPWPQNRGTPVLTVNVYKLVFSSDAKLHAVVSWSVSSSEEVLASGDLQKEIEWTLGDSDSYVKAFDSLLQSLVEQVIAVGISEG